MHKEKKQDRGLLAIAVLSLIWFVFRTGTKPSRITYPCQKAAMLNMSMLLPVSLISGLVKVKHRILTNKVKISIFAIALIVVMLFSAIRPPASTVVIALEIPENEATEFPASDVFTVDGGASLNDLFDLMRGRGLDFYSLINSDDVVIIKVNAQHIERGRTNTDLVKELVDIIRAYPGGFSGEIVIADNPQGVAYGMDPPNKNNAEDRNFGFQDIANMYSNVETILWDSIETTVSDYDSGDNRNGYVIYNTAELGNINYPKFTTSRGTKVSLLNGVWNGAEYEDQLKLINFPVLKTHGQYGVTGAVKNYLGVTSKQFFNFHGLYTTNPFFTTYITAGITGLEMAKIIKPTLNILDALWIQPRPRSSGSTSHYSDAVYVGNILASTDPVALDYISSKYVIMPTAQSMGYTDLRYVDPDYDGVPLLQGSFHYMIKNSMNFLRAEDYTSNMDESYINVIREVGEVQYELTVGVVGSGSTSPATGNHMYDEGALVPVDATADAGWMLNHWLLDGVDVGSADPYTVTMNADHSLIVIFVETLSPDVFVEIPGSVYVESESVEGIEIVITGKVIVEDN